MARSRIQQTYFVCRDEHVTGFVQSAPARATEHLQNLVGAERLFDGVTPIRLSGERDTPQRKVDAGRQTHRGDDGAELAGFGERFDDAGPGSVTETAVMIRNAALEHFGQVLADDLFLLGAEWQRVRNRQLARELGSHALGGLPAGGEN